MWEKTKKEWVIWTQTRQEYFVDNKMMYSEIVVPTFDSIRMQYLTRILILNNLN